MFKQIAADGMPELYISLSPDLTPFIKCRAVLQEDGTYIAIVRDYNTGILIDRCSKSFKDKKEALNHAVTSSLEYIEMCMENKLSS